MTRLAVLFAVEFVAFALATANFRMCARGDVAATVSTDFAIAMFGYLVVRLIAAAEATSWIEAFAYASGGAAGSFLAMRLTKERR
jgi:hypothetical protein